MQVAHGNDARASASAWRRLTLATALVASLTLLGGCVGIAVSSADYVDIRTDLKTREDVQARLGKPVEIRQEGDLEVWTYLLRGQGLAGPASEGTMNGVFLIVTLVKMTDFKDNVRVSLKDGQVVRVQERDDKEHGLVCGLDGHNLAPMCMGGHGSTRTATPPRGRPADALPGPTAPASGPAT